MRPDNTANITFSWEDNLYYKLNLYGIVSHSIHMDMQQKCIYKIDFDHLEEGTLINFDNAGMYFVVEKYDLTYQIEDSDRTSKDLLEGMNSFTLKFCDAWYMPLDVWKLSLQENGKSFRCTHVKPAIHGDENISASCIVSRETVNELFYEYEIYKWKGKYNSPEGTGILDGYVWNMWLNSKYAHVEAHGINGHPDRFDEFCKRLTALAKGGKNVNTS